MCALDSTASHNPYTVPQLLGIHLDVSFMLIKVQYQFMPDCFCIIFNNNNYHIQFPTKSLRISTKFDPFDIDLFIDLEIFTLFDVYSE